MQSSPLFDYFATFVGSKIDWIHEHFIHPVGLLQAGIIGVTYLIARFLATKIRQYLDKDYEKVKTHVRIALNPVQLATLLGYLMWLFLLWFSQVLFLELKVPAQLLSLAIRLAVAWLVLRFAYFYIQNTFWSRFVYICILTFLALNIFDLWAPTVELLNSMIITVGRIQLSVFGLLKAIIVFIFILTATGVVNRFIAHRLANSNKLKASDRILIQRAIKGTMLVVAALISLQASGVDMTILAVTGGALGFAVGIGLQKVGSNLVAGVMLLISKPVRQGDVIAFDKGKWWSRYGWITDIGPMYVQVATRDGKVLLVPNESFVTQEIENLTYHDNLVRVTIPFGISYKSDLKMAMSLSTSVAANVDRILKDPAPQCLISGFGDSTVNLILRLWISDPRNGVANVKGAVLSSVWDAFHDHNIEIAFPQRDLHIKDSVPLKIYNEKLQGEMDSPSEQMPAEPKAG